LALFSITPAYSNEDAILPAKIQVALIYNMLGYINNIEQLNNSGKIPIGIIFDDTMAAQAFSKDMLKNFLITKSLNIKIQNIEVDPFLLKYGNEAEILDSLKNKKAKVIYIVIMSDDNMKAVLGVTKQLGILSITGIKTKENVKKGVSIGFGITDNKPAILINTRSLKSEDKEFSKDFYPLTKTVDE